MTLQQLAAYLPYGLKVEYGSIGEKKESTIYGIDFLCGAITVLAGTKHCPIELIKPILRPLSQLNETIMHDGNEVSIGDVILSKELRDSLNLYIKEEISYWHLPYIVVDTLLKYHFNVFDLPESEYTEYINSKNQ